MSHEGTSGKLRFGVLCHGTCFAAWQAKCIRHLMEDGAADPALLIVEPRKSPALSRKQRQPALAAALFQRLRPALGLTRDPGALRPVDLSADLSTVPTITCATAGHGDLPHVLSLADVEIIRAHKLDFIVQFASGPLDGDILTAARFGVWAFGSDERDRRLSIFWELHWGAAAHRVSLWKLDGAGRGKILHSGLFRRQRTLARAFDATLLGSADWCARVCRQITLGQVAPLFSSPASRPLPICRPPTGRESLRLLLAQLTTWAGGAFRRSFLLDYWNVGIVDASVETIMTTGKLPSPRWLPSPRRLRYHADPFALPERPDVIFLEEYSHVRSRGHIVWRKSSDDAASEPIAAFERKTHLSYPYLVSADGDIFCVPETAEDGSVELYRAIRFPDQWERAATLIQFPALDSTILRHNEHWWLFCGSSEEGGESKLYAWYAASLYGPWQPHALNPLKCDISSSRPAGRPFVTESRLYRPAQDCSRTYGGAITINRIITLTPTEFDEIPVGYIAPDPNGPYPHGVHTLCAIGDRTIIDGKRFVFDLRAPYVKFRALAHSRQAPALHRRGTPLQHARAGVK